MEPMRLLTPALLVAGYSMACDSNGRDKSNADAGGPVSNAPNAWLDGSPVTDGAVASESNLSSDSIASVDDSSTPTDGPSIPTDAPSSLEARPADSGQPSGFAFSIQISDPKTLLTGLETRGFEENLSAALEFWGQTIRGRGTLDVLVRIDTSSSGGRFEATCTTSFYRGLYRGNTVAECCTTYELRTGMDPNGAMPDIIIDAIPAVMRASYWIDSSPRTRTERVPANKGDLVSLLAHELGHGLGFIGNINSKTLAFPSDKYIMLFDSFVETTGMNPVFTGPNAVSSNGGNPVGLCHTGLCPYEYLYHTRTRPYAAAAGDPYVYGLMAGHYIENGKRYRLSPAEIGILRDLALSVD